MGFDKHFYEDHCYLDDPTNDVGMNVEVMEENSEALHHVTDEKPGLRCSSSAFNTCSESTDCETTNNYDTAKKVISHVYIPYTEFCTEHTDMLLLEDEKLVKPGDKFETHDAFIQYLNENAKRWFFYYKCSDSRKPNTEYESYTYTCVYLRNKEKYKKKGLRKRNNNTKTDCPCKIKLRHLPNEKELTVVYVCNHHDHELSLEQFCKLQHGRRLPPYVKEEIMDFLTLQVDKGKIKKYVEMETGFSMSRPFFYALEKNLQKTKSTERQITEDRLQMLNEKIAAVEEIYGSNDDENPEQNGEFDEEAETLRRSKPKPVLKSFEHSVNKCSQIKRKPTPTDEVSSTDCAKRIKVEPCHEVTYSETMQSVKDLQESVKCDVQENPWVSDQSIPVLPNRPALLDETHSVTQHDPETDNCNYNLECYNHQDNTKEIVNDFITINNDHDEASNENDIDNIAYETVVTDNDVTYDEAQIVDGNETHNETQDYVNGYQINHDEITIYNGDSQETINGINRSEFDGIQDTIEVDHVEYMIEDGENLVQYVDDTNVDNSAHDVGVQTYRNMDAGQTLLPVFDVYMKDGNVTGFVVNNNLINGLKDGVDKGIQTSEDIIYSDIQDIENEDSEIFQDSSDQNGDTFTKHEYVHKYNIDLYMTQAHFPKYIEILAKETHTDVLDMFTNIYNEKAMFKLTTTQKGNEGNTRIRYITHNGRINKKKIDDSKKEKFGKNLQSIFVLKEKMRSLKKQNDELLKRNKYLEDVALRLVQFD